jgi:hypothetical protein
MLPSGTDGKVAEDQTSDNSADTALADERYFMFHDCFNAFISSCVPGSPCKRPKAAAHITCVS